MQTQFKNVFGEITRQINCLFANKEPWQVASITAISLMTGLWLWEQINHDENICGRAKKKFFKLLRLLPPVQRKIDSKVAKMSIEMEKSVLERTAHMSYFTRLPPLGLSNEELLVQFEKYLTLGEYKWKEGRVSGAVYNFNDELCELVSTVYQKTAYTNPLHADIFPGINKMEAEVVRMCAAMFNGDAETVGTMTTGGTESLIMACKAYRDYAREVKGIHKPNIVMPRTAHAGFDKAAQYFNIHINYVDVDPISTKVNVSKLAKAIDKNTIMIYPRHHDSDRRATDGTNLFPFCMVVPLPATPMQWKRCNQEFMPLCLGFTGIKILMLLTITLTLYSCNS